LALHKGTLLLLIMTRLGQNLTVDEGLLRRLVDLAEPSSEDVVLEPGCGDGRLTELIARRGCRVIGVEIDPLLSAAAMQRLSAWKNVTIMQGDVLKLKPTGFTMVMGSPPYYISRRLIEWLASEAMPRKIVLVLQKEFAEKLAALPGSNKYHYISLLSQMFYEIALQGKAHSTSFRPRPRVTSMITVMKKIDTEPLQPSHLRILKQIFTDRRHKVRKLLRRLGYDARLLQVANKRVYELAPQEALTMIRALTLRKG